MKENNKSVRILELDALRGLAAISVVFFHYTTLCYVLYHYNSPFYLPWRPYRDQLFALISGFVIPMVLERSERPLDFVVARFSRLYPCYFFTVILISLLMMYFPSPFTGGRVQAPMFFANLTMLQTWLGYDNADGVFWFLAPELTFYVIIFLFAAFNKMKYLERVGLLGLILVVLNGRYGSFGPVGIPAVVVLSRILCYWQYFFAGILFYNLKDKGDVWWRHTAIASCFVVQNVISDDVYTVFCFAACLLVFYLFIYGKLSWIAQKPLLFLGTISYSLFLIHQDMGLTIIRYLYKMGTNAWLRIIIPTVISIIVATMMTYFIEKPAMKFIRAKYKQWRQPL